MSCNRMNCPSWRPRTSSMVRPGYRSHSLEVGRWMLTIALSRNETQAATKFYLHVLLSRATGGKAVTP